MSTVYLHIGPPKTGTTAIQNFFENNKEALAQNNACFPDFNLRYIRPDHYFKVAYVRNAHFLVKAWRSLLTDKPNATYLSVLDQLEELGKKYDKIILSDESLWIFGDKHREGWAVLKSDLEKRGLKLCVVAYLRRQDSFVLSYYRQMVRVAITELPFYEYWDTLQNKYPMDYYSYTKYLAGVIGKENVFFRVYERGQFRGEEHNIYSDFLEILGLSLKDGFVLKKEVYNTSPDDSLLELRRILNQLPNPDRYNQLLMNSYRAILRDRAEERPPKTSFFRPGEQTAYLESFAESNSRFAREYLGREDGTLFYDQSDTELPEYEVITEDLLRDTILYYAKVAELLEKENNKLRAEFEEVRKYVPLYHLHLKTQSYTEKAVRALKNFLDRIGLKKPLKHLLGKDRKKTP